MLSGVHLLPYTLAACAASILSGVYVSRAGYYIHPAILGSILTTIGSGVLASLQVDSTPAKWIGYQVLTSAGMTMTIAQGYNAIEIPLGRRETSIGLAAMLACQSFGAAVFIAAGNTIMQNRLSANVRDARLEGLDLEKILRSGAINFNSFVEEDRLPVILEMYNDALRGIFYMVVPLAGLAIVACLFLGWTHTCGKGSEETA
jgi:hypothetical protein